MATKEPKSAAKSAGATNPVSKPVVKAEAVAVTAAPKASAKPARPRAAAKPAVAPVQEAAPAPVAAPAPTAVAATPVAAAAPVAPALVTPPADAAPAAAVSPTTTSTKKALTMENALHTVTEKTQALFADMNDRTKVAVEKSTQMLADMNEFGKGNVEAIVESSKIAAKGMETLGQDAAEFTRKSFEGATAAMRNMASVKTPADFMKLQSELVRTAFDSLVAETSKNTEAMLKLAGDVAQPLSNRVAVAAEKVKTAA